MKIGIIGLGYVGIQLALAFGKKHQTIGFDLDESKLDAYRASIDRTGEVEIDQFSAAVNLIYSSEKIDLVGCDVYIIAVPTPVDCSNRPNFEPLLNASETVGRVMSSKAIVVYESTVYPGATEEVCVPVLERVSGLSWKKDFNIGYSPERINPGDSKHTLQSIKKVVSGDCISSLKTISDLYSTIVPAGVYETSSIQVAEAAKVIENTQRDLNIALVNELSIIFDRLGLDTTEVLQAAGSKWNFLPFRPGLVGGHCIGVDPYYLMHKAEMVGYRPQVILAGRRINDAMGIVVAEKTLTLLRNLDQKGRSVVNVLGVTFKENCSDVRNSQVFSLIKYLQDHGVEVNVADPLADPVVVRNEQGIELVPIESLSLADALVIAVPHQSFDGEHLVEKLMCRAGIFIDVKSAYRDAIADRPDIIYWSL